MSNHHSKRDIDVQKIKVKNVFFEFSALSYICPYIYFYNTDNNVYGCLLSIYMYIMYIGTTNSQIGIPHQREHCKTAPRDCCLSLKPYYIFWTIHLSQHKNMLCSITIIEYNTILTVIYNRSYACLSLTVTYLCYEI